MIDSAKSSTGKKKVSIIKLILFGCACLVVGLSVAAWILFQQFAWKIEWREGLDRLSSDRVKGKQMLEKAMHDCDAANPTVAEQMSCHRGYAEVLYYDGETKEADEQIAQAIALMKGADPAASSAEADQLTHAYQDRAWNQHALFLKDPSLPSGDKDQEMSVAVAEKSYGPAHEQTVYKLPSLAVIYADMNLPDKADKIISRCITAVDTSASAKECGWFVYCMDCRVKAVEHKYQAALKSFLHARELAKDDSQRDRIWAEFSNGLEHGKPVDETTQKIVALVAKENFAQLEQLAGELRKAQTPCADGTWKLDVLYGKLAPRDDANDSDFSQRIFELKKWLTDSPRSITARNGLSQAYIEYAWNARGGGYSDSVTANGWKLFASRLTQAKQTLDEDPTSTHECPRTFRNYSKVALGQGLEKKKYMKLVDECHKLWPQYHDIDIATVWYLQPRWFGEEHEAAKYMQGRADAIGGAKGDELYAQLVWNSSGYTDDLFAKDSGISWKRTKSGFKQIFADFPNDLEARITFIKLALTTGDENSIKTVFDGYK